MTGEWLIVLNGDGTVLAVDGGAPTDWIGTRVEDRSDVPLELRQAAAETRTESLGRRSLGEGGEGQPVRLLVLHAVPIRRTPTDIRALLQSTINVMQRQARALEVALTLEVGPDVPQTLEVDPEKLAWSITALVGNSLRFVRRGTRLMPGGAIHVRARLDPAAASVIVEVQDDGSGIPKDILPQLLQRPPGQLHASGLALSLVQDVVCAHGGMMHLESSTEADHSGTTMRLSFPCS